MVLLGRLIEVTTMTEDMIALPAALDRCLSEYVEGLPKKLDEAFRLHSQGVRPRNWEVQECN